MSEEKPHPLLVIPRDDGVLMVIGQRQIFMRLSQKQQINLAIELLKRAAVNETPSEGDHNDRSENS